MEELILVRAAFLNLGSRSLPASVVTILHFLTEYIHTHSLSPSLCVLERRRMCALAANQRSNLSRARVQISWE